MNVAIILGAGRSQRTDTKTPKQFTKINNKPLLLYPIEKFYKNKNIDLIIVVSNKKMFNKYIKFDNKNKKVICINGGDCRNHSIKKAINFLKKINIDNNSNILIHDGCRIFITQKIINDNINMIQNNKAVLTSIDSIDTIITVNKNNEVLKVDKRDFLLQEQTPQTVKFNLLQEIFNKKINDEIFQNEDLSKILLINNIKMKICPGNQKNYKITTNYDIQRTKKTFILADNN